MRIRKLTLSCRNLESQKSFYQQTLGFKLEDITDISFSVKVGWTYLTFKQDAQKQDYHYCFLIPSNQHKEGIQWFQERLDLVMINKKPNYFFSTWNAESFYFFDGDQNISECIVRYDLENNSALPFGTGSLLCVNEIGTPSTTIKKHNQQLTELMNSKLWKGDLERFATNGNQEGLFLLANNSIKKVWFPTQVPTLSADYDALIKTSKGTFNIAFSNAQLNITKSEH